MKQEDREIHAAYLNSRDDEERELGDFYESTWMMTNEQIHQRMDDQIGYKEVEEALKCSLEIGEKVEEYDLYCPTIVPGADIPDFELSDFFGNYYDRYEKIEGENPTIGILLCKQSDEALVDLTLPENANIYAKEYKLYLPDKKLLQKKLKEWLDEEQN